MPPIQHLFVRERSHQRWPAHAPYDVSAVRAAWFRIAYYEPWDGRDYDT